MQKKITRAEALEYHTGKRHGKLAVIATKPCVTQRDLSLAYTPGVAEPCLDIAKDARLAYEYTNKGNLVAVVSNGTAVLGLGDIGAIAGKPVMEGKGVLFKRFADIDVFDIEVESHDPKEIIRFCQLLEPTLGGINLEDIKAPECFEIEEELKRTMGIPVFHDDQHGTAIISGAALLNGCEIVGKPLDKIKVVFCGAGAAGIACANFYLLLGVKPENLLMVDTKGVIYKGRTAGMNPYKEKFAQDTDARTLADAMRGADVFAGVSTKGMLTQEMVKTMAKDAIIFAMANPDPEITPEEVFAVRKDVIMATGRSDYPNQVNNVLGFPFIFRGALDVAASSINEEMKLAASRALAALAKEDVPDSVIRAYGGQPFKFGRNYVIPKPFDYRVLLWEAPAVAEAAIRTGVARAPYSSRTDYVRELENRLSRTRQVMHFVFDQARLNPKRIVFPEGEAEKIVRAAKILVNEGLCRPVLLGQRETIGRMLAEHEIGADSVEVVDPATDERAAHYAERLHEMRWRKGVTAVTAAKLMQDPVYFGNMMVHEGDADGLIAGLTMSYPETIRPALQIHKTLKGVRKACGVYLLLFEDRMLFIADTTVNQDPTAEDLAEIAHMAAAVAQTYFGEQPRVAMLSYSNFGSNSDEHTRKIQEAVAIAEQRWPDLVIEGEMQADTAVDPNIARDTFPSSRIFGDANVLVCPDLASANIAYKLLWRLGKVEAIGPILSGIGAPVHVLQRGVEVTDIVNMTAMCVRKAQRDMAELAEELAPR
ncbi:MAG TPA: NADP-dependent malic enzyme [Thermoanaerobaculales bacterium]|nr:NADP-dependent malic enzyme [Thermoanaerobaculales bacterium]HQL29727.1 NADP-dependent malic enzyme [Thermoanaerobaculales bacterium]HQN95983.1 NADP-dependent malic enzyme [Thermoanaerobaculales bacterium]